jgi:hypothetical protein
MIALMARLYGIEKAARDGQLTAEARHELQLQGAGDLASYSRAIDRLRTWPN